MAKPFELNGLADAGELVSPGAGDVGERSGAERKLHLEQLATMDPLEYDKVRKSETGFRAEVHGLVCSAVLGYSALHACQLL